MKPYKRGRIWWLEFSRKHLGATVAFRHSCATRDSQKAHAMGRMLTKLVEDHRWDILTMLAEGAYRVPDVFAYHEAGRLHEVRTSRELVRVDAAVATFAVEAECGYHAFRQHLAKYPGGRVRPYRTRHTFAHWCERARIPKTRIRLYLGHSARSVTDDYLWHEVQAFVRKDAGRFRALLGDGRVAVKRGTA